RRASHHHPFILTLPTTRLSSLTGVLVFQDDCSLLSPLFLPRARNGGLVRLFHRGGLLIYRDRPRLFHPFTPLLATPDLRELVQVGSDPRLGLPGQSFRHALVVFLHCARERSLTSLELQEGGSLRICRTHYSICRMDCLGGHTCCEIWQVHIGVSD